MHAHTAPAEHPAGAADDSRTDDMRAVAYRRFGGPEVLRPERAPRPHAGAGRVRIAVAAASVNPFDLKKRAGMFARGDAPESPVVPGVEAAGVVDEVGEGVSGVAVGDEVFGLGPATFAEYAVLEHWARRPAAWSWAQAASVSTAAEAARRALDLLGVAEGRTLLIDGASGSVGMAAAQFALAAGADVIGTASPRRQERLRLLGIAAVDHGPGLAERIADATGGGVDAVLDASGLGSLEELIAVAGGPGHVVSLADFDAPDLGVRVSSTPSAFGALAEAAGLAEQGRFDVAVAAELALEDAADAHARAEHGADGKVVVLP